MPFNKILLFPFALLMAACGGPERPRVPVSQAPAMAVSVITAAPAEWPQTMEAVGTVRARTAAALSSRVTGYVREVRVRAGDRVQAGQLLVVLEARDLETGRRRAEAALAEARSAMPETDSAIASAAAQLELAMTTHRRMQDLLTKQSVSRQEFDESASRVKVAQAGVQMAQARKRQLGEKIRQAEEAVGQASIALDYAELKAPFAARVTARRVEPGALASPGLPLIELEQDAGYRLEVSVDESRLGDVRLGEPVTVRLDTMDSPFRARVSEIVPSVDEASRAFTVKIDLPGNPALRSGLFGRALFAAGARHVLAIPHAAVIVQGQVRSVMAVEDGAARLRLVTLGARRGEDVEVLSGLRPGDKVIYPVPPALEDGRRVEVR